MSSDTRAVNKVKCKNGNFFFPVHHGGVSVLATFAIGDEIEVVVVTFFAI
jgi:hypothetical protein